MSSLNFAGMLEIEFTANLEGEKKNVRLLSPDGGDSYHVYINNYYQGTIVKLKGQWIGHMNERCKFTERQILKLGGIIDEGQGLNQATQGS